jgi:uncharacterized protein
LLTADLVRVRRRGGTLSLVPLSDRTRPRALEIARAYVDAVQAVQGERRDALDAALAAVPLGVRERKLAAGLRKLILDRCTFEVASPVDPIEARQVVFRRAAEARRGVEGFDRGVVLAEVATHWGVAPEALEDALYADVRGAQVLTHFDALTGEGLLERYELGQAQAVLLRATQVTFRVQGADPEAYRRLFRRIKFHRLLHRIDRDGPEGYRIEVTGPFSLFESVTKYGLQLAMVLPAVRACGRWSLEAQVCWGKDRTPLSFALEGRADTVAHDDEAHLPDEVRTLLQRFEERTTPWRARPCTEILDLPGVGLCVPDLVFEHQRSGARAFVEVLGYWSRAAVWKRVELVEGGLTEPIVFAVSKRLRVREEVLPEDAPAALYVFKGTLSAAAIETRLTRLTKGREGREISQ